MRAPHFGAYCPDPDAPVAERRDHSRDFHGSDNVPQVAWGAPGRGFTGRGVMLLLVLPAALFGLGLILRAVL